MFKGDYQESKPSEIDGLYRWTIDPMFDPEAFKMVMKIIHLRTHELPENVTLEMMANIAAVVDDLQCHEAVSFFTKIWISRLPQPLPSAICDDLIRWVLIASVFRTRERYKSATRVAILHSTGPIPTLGLPIYPDIVGMLFHCVRVTR